MALLEAEHIGKAFGKTQVLRGVNFSMEKGQVVSIIGSSGSGKTTFLRCLNFLERPDTGVIRLQSQVLFDAADPRTLREKEIRKKRLHFGLVFQNFNLFPQYTALDNVILARDLLAREQPDYARNRKQIQEEIRAQAESLLRQMGLGERMGNYPGQLSGGQQQRVAIARALALNPEILCFDEPTSALDPLLTKEVLSVIRDLAREKRTMVVVTHEMDFAREVADRVVYMEDGVIAADGTPQQVFSQERVRAFAGQIQ